MQTPATTPEKLDWCELIVAARAGDDVALGTIMAEQRIYLLAVADDNLGEGLRAKFGPSDIVQQSFVEVQQALPTFRGSTEGEIRAWLKQIVIHNLMDSARRYKETRSRDVGREVSIDRLTDEKKAWDGGLCPNSKTPSSHVRRGETDEQLMNAVASLPARQRQVVEMRHRLGSSYLHIGAELGIAESAARSLWMRAMKNLRDKLGGDGG